MKLNINKLQEGGQVFYSSVANPTITKSSSSTTTKKSSDDDSLISKSLLDELSKKGIPNDFNKFIAMLSNYENKLSKGFGIDKNGLYQLRAYANQIIQQSSYLEQAVKRAETNGAIDEFAVDPRGFLYVYDDEGKIKKIHASNFKYGEDIALTVGELIQQRRFNMNEVDNESLSTVIGNNIGTEKINDYILEIIKTIGSTSNSSEAYQDLATILGSEMAKKPSEQQQKTVKELYDLSQKIGLDAIFKIKNSESSKNIQEAMNYIMSMLPNNMKTQLIARNVVQGGDYKKSNDYAYNIIASALTASNDVKISSEIDYNQDINKGAGTSSGSKEQNRNLNVMEQLIQGSLGQKEYKIISKYNPDVSMTLKGSGIGQLSDFDNNIISKTPLSVAFQLSLGPLIDQNHMSMGDQKITSEMLDTILYDGGDVLNIWAPVNGNGDIDLEGLAIFSDIQKVIRNNPQLTTEDKNELLQKNGLQGYFDDQNKFHGTGNMAQFLVMTGLTSDEVIDPDTNIFSDKLSKEDKDFTFNQIERIYGQLNKNIKKKDGQYEFIKGWFNWSTDLVKAPVFLKLNDTAQIDVGTFSGKGPLVQTPSYQQQLAYDQMRNERKKQIITPSTQLLYDERNQ